MSTAPLGRAVPAEGRCLAGVTSAMIEPHVGWVRRQAQALVRHLPANVERADLIQVGLVAVAMSLTTFEWAGDRNTEPARDAFVRYARMRVKGAMLDELRQMDFLSRSERRKIKQIRRASERHLAMFGTEANLAQLASDTGMTRDEIGSLLQADALGRNQVDAEEEPGRPQHFYPSTSPGDVEDRVSSAVALREFGAYLDSLPERDQMVLEAYLGTGLGPIDTAAALHVTPSRVSQIYGQLVARICRERWAAGVEPPPKVRRAVSRRRPAPAAAPAAPVLQELLATAPEPEPEPPEIALDPGLPIEHLFAADIVCGCDASLLR